MPQVPSSRLSRILSNHGDMAGTLSVYPKNFRFETQNHDEQVFIKARAHPIVNFGWVFNTAFLIIMPVTVAYFGSVLPLNINITELFPTNILLAVLLFFYSVVITNAFFNFLDWYYDVYIITNQRMVNIQFDPLKRHKITEAKLTNIENVEESVIGLFPGLFNYGDIRVSTAANKGLFVFRSVPDPTWFRDAITDLSNYVRGNII